MRKTKALKNERANRERNIKISHNYYILHKEEMNTRDKNNRAKNIDYFKNLQRLWRQTHPDRCRIYSSMHRNHAVNKEEKESMLSVFKYKCAYCGMTQEDHLIKYHEKLHNDHVDPNGKNDLSNCSKHTKDMETWFREQPFFTEEKLNKIKWWITEGYKKYIV